MRIEGLYIYSSVNLFYSSQKEAQTAQAQQANEPKRIEGIGRNEDSLKISDKARAFAAEGGGAARSEESQMTYVNNAKNDRHLQNESKRWSSTVMRWLPRQVNKSHIEDSEPAREKVATAYISSASKETKENDLNELV